MKEVLNQDPGEVAGMLKDPCYTRKELAKVLVTTKRKLEEAQQSRDAAWKEAVEAKDKVGFLQCCLCFFPKSLTPSVCLCSMWPAKYYWNYVLLCTATISTIYRVSPF